MLGATRVVVSRDTGTTVRDATPSVEALLCPTAVIAAPVPIALAIPVGFWAVDRIVLPARVRLPVAGAHEVGAGRCWVLVARVIMDSARLSPTGPMVRGRWWRYRGRWRPGRVPSPPPDGVSVQKVTPALQRVK
jgi:hypothetical protein